MRWPPRPPRCGAASPSTAWCPRSATATGSPLRMEVRRPHDGPVLVVDCYNANPASTEAALRSMAALPAGRKLALLGLMAELGPETEGEHRRSARLAEELGIEVVGYQTGLYGPAQVASADEAVALLRRLGPGDAALVKGSRVARLEDVVAAVRRGDRRVVSRWRPARAALHGVPSGSGADEDPPGQLAVEGFGARRGRAARVEGVDPALAVAPLQAETVGVAFGRGHLHGGPGEGLAVGLDEPGLLQAPAGEVEVPASEASEAMGRRRRRARRRCARRVPRASHHA